MLIHVKRPFIKKSFRFYQGNATFNAIVRKKGYNTGQKFSSIITKNLKLFHYCATIKTGQYHLASIYNDSLFGNEGSVFNYKIQLLIIYINCLIR